MTEKYFLPPVPPAKLETLNALNMELTKWKHSDGMKTECYLHIVSIYTTSLSLTCIPGEMWWPVFQKGFLGLPLAPSLTAHMREKKSLNWLLWERDSKGILRLAVLPKVGAWTHLSLSCSSVSATIDEPRVIHIENPGVDGIRDGEGTMINWRGQVCLQRQLCLPPDNWCQCTSLMVPPHVLRESQSLQILNIEN